MMDGYWLELDLRIERPRTVSCSTCGAMLPRKAWIGSAGEAHPYCTPGCEVLEARVAVLESRYPAHAEERS